MTVREIKTVEAKDVKVGDEIASFLTYSPSDGGTPPDFDMTPWGTVTEIEADDETVYIRTDQCSAGEWAAWCDLNEPVKVFA